MSLASELNISLANRITFAIDGDVDCNAQSQKLGFLQAHLLSTFSESFPCCHRSKDHYSLWRKKESNTKFFQDNKNILQFSSLIIIAMLCALLQFLLFICTVTQMGMGFS